MHGVAEVDSAATTIGPLLLLFAKSCGEVVAVAIQDVACSALKKKVATQCLAEALTAFLFSN